MLKIGVFDSGLGGLTVVKALMSKVKGAELFYIADTKNAPYGEKTPEQILKYSLDITNFFIEKHQINVLIVACNTATSAAIQNIRKKYPKLIVIGTEPGIKPAIELSCTQNIGVLATPATLKGEKYQQLVNELSMQHEITLFEQPCPGLVEQIENGEVDTDKTKQMLELWLKPMRMGNVDTIVLGCTHYPLICKTIEEVMNRKMTLIDTGNAIAKRVLHLTESIKHTNKGTLNLFLYSTSDIDTDIVSSILGNNNSTQKIKQIEIESK